MSDQDLEEFGVELSKVQADSQIPVAEITQAIPMKRYQYHASVDPSDDDARDVGLTVTYRRTGSDEFSEWYEKPAEWSMLRDLPLLLDYLGVAPGEVTRLNDDDERFEVPITLTDSWAVDWDALYEEVTGDE